VKFYRGHKEKIRKLINLFKSKTLNDAINMALEIEETMKVGEKKGRFFRNS
jgi:hypothetical protein